MLILSLLFKNVKKRKEKVYQHGETFYHPRIFTLQIQQKKNWTLTKSLKEI